MQVKCNRVGWVALMLLHCSANAQSTTPAGCVPIESAGFLVTRPGVYCVTKDLNTRLDFADHRAEVSIIEIRSGNVTIDLQGHRIGRGRLVTQRGGYGILITTKQHDGEPGSAPRIKNVTIRNALLADFNVGIEYSAVSFQTPSLTHQVKQTGENSFVYEEANIVIDNVKFERCGDDMNVQDWFTR